MKKVFFSFIAIAAFVLNSNAQEESKQQEPVKAETQSKEEPVKVPAQQTPGINRLSVDRISKLKTKELKSKAEVVNEKKITKTTTSTETEVIEN